MTTPTIGKALAEESVATSATGADLALEATAEVEDIAKPG